jgi:hypothetical protein
MEKHEPSQMLCVEAKVELAHGAGSSSRQDTPDRPEPTIPVVTPRRAAAALHDRVAA